MLLTSQWAVSLTAVLATLSVVSCLPELPTLQSLPVSDSQAKRHNPPTLTIHAVGEHALRLQRRAGNPSPPFPGTGIKIGIIDSGIDYKHPALGGCFGKGCKVALGYDFVGDDFDGYNDPQPDSDPMDECNGHGTHVAGIIAAESKELTGVAPKATLGAYRVFGCTGQVSLDVLISAMRRAAADQMDVINISIGTTRFFADTEDALEAQKLVDSGIIVVASAGNDGGTYMGGVNSPSTAPGVMSVASLTMDELTSFYFTEGNTGKMIEYLSAKGTAIPTTAATQLRTVPLKVEDGCGSLPTNLGGNFLLLIRGKCSFSDKALHAQQVGAAGVIVISDTPDLEQPYIEDSVTIHVVLVNADSGKRLRTALSVGTAKDRIKLTWNQGVTQRPIDKPGFTSVFSTFGPSSNLTYTKPDIAATGNQVLSTYPRKLGNWAIATGTSMAAPSISGMAARVVQRIGTRASRGSRPGIVRRVLVQDAEFQHWPSWMPYRPKDPNYILPIYYSGAGLTRERSLTVPEWGIHVQSLGFVGNADGSKTTHTFTVQLVGPIPAGKVKMQSMHATTVSDWDNGKLKPNTYMDISTSIILSPQWLDFPKATNPDDLMKVHPQKVTITIITPTLSSKTALWMLSGVVKALHIDATTQAEMTRRVPYQATVGNLRSTGPIQRDADYPRLEAVYQLDYVNGTADVYSSQAKRHIALRFRTLLPSVRGFVTVVRVKDSVVLGYASGLDGTSVPTSPEGEDMDHWSEWGGHYQDMPKFGQPSGTPKPVPKDRYRLHLYIARLYADANVEANYDVWKSPEFDVVDVDPANGVSADSTTLGTPLARGVPATVFGRIM